VITDPTQRLLYQLMAENRQHARLSEDRRIAITAVTVLAASGILVALTVVPPGVRTLPLALWLTGLGASSTFVCLKLHERAQFHERRARQLRARLIELTPERTSIDQAQGEAEAAHRREHSRLSSLRLNTLLVALNLLVALLGLLFVVLSLARLA
jgi:hypothetical protein